jgi:hypothetical protein
MSSSAFNVILRHVTEHRAISPLLHLPEGNPVRQKHTVELYFVVIYVGSDSIGTSDPDRIRPRVIKKQH